MSRTRRTARAGAALTVLGAVFALGALAAMAGPSAGAVGRSGSAAFPPFRPTRVLALGDSVLQGAAPNLPGALPGREVVVDTEVSRSTGATAAAAARQGSDWDVVVIFVGHNDGGSAGAYQPPYRAMLDQFAAVPRVVVVTIHEVRPYYPAVNAFLRGEAAARPNVRVADWNAIAGPGTTAGDGLHLTGGGAGALARLIADQVTVAEFEFLPTTTTTTAPPTTLAPTTTAPEVVLAPPISIDREPPPTTTTTTAPSTTTVPSTTVPASPPTGSLGEDGDGGSAPAALWPVLGLAMLAGAGGLGRLARRLPT